MVGLVLVDGHGGAGEGFADLEAARAAADEAEDFQFAGCERVEEGGRACFSRMTPPRSTRVCFGGLQRLFTLGPETKSPPPLAKPRLSTPGAVLSED